jgi:hypothetical protein
MKDYPRQMARALTIGFRRGLLQIWESVPGYPPKPPGSKYRRKVSGGIGGSLGVSESGGRSGKADVFEVKSRSGFVSAEFGSRLGYARHVIGDRETQQAGHMRHWWTLNQTVWEKAAPKVQRTFEVIVQVLAQFLEGKGEPKE